MLAFSNERTETKRRSFLAQVTHFLVKNEINLVEIWLRTYFLKDWNRKDEKKYVKLEMQILAGEKIKRAIAGEFN